MSDVALVYDRVNKWGGAERLLLSLHKLFPHAPLYTSVYSSKHASWAHVFPSVISSFLNIIPYLRSRHEIIPYLMPVAFESFDFSSYKLVISVSSESAKGIVTCPSTTHINYCLTPTRYLWSSEDIYFANSFVKTISKPITKFLKKWDVNASTRPDKYIAVSEEVKKRIDVYYHRSSSVIYPPVNVNFFAKANTKNKKHFLVVSRLVSYKKVDLVVQAFNKLKKKLVIVGTGSQETYLKKIAGRHITFLSSVSDAHLRTLYGEAYALIFMGIEDFGIAMVEAQAAGTPVIAYNMGGAKEIITSGTGLLLDSQDPVDLLSIIEKFDYLSYDKKTIQANALRFADEVFERKIQRYVRKYL
jgi:glycosyltransferase involved in cell wall biosynthesis